MEGIAESPIEFSPGGVARPIAASGPGGGARRTQIWRHVRQGIPLAYRPVRSLSIDLLRALGANAAAASASYKARDLRSLALECGVDRALLRRCLKELAEHNYVRLRPDSVLLAAQFDFLSAPHIRSALGERQDEVEILVLNACESTNTVLLAQALESGEARRARFLIAEEQTAGRGRRGRKWLSAVGQAVTCSLAVQFTTPLRQLSGLSLAVGVAAARALRGAGAANLALKWPNDLLLGGAKLGGILVETRASHGLITAVIGIGINHTLQPGLGERLKREVTSLAEWLRPLPSRNEIAGRILRELLNTLEAFRARGLDAVRAEWTALHGHAGQRLRVRLADGRVVAGLAEGVDQDGALVLRTRTGLTPVTSGEVLSARLA